MYTPKPWKKKRNAITSSQKENSLHETPGAPSTSFESRRLAYQNNFSDSRGGQIQKPFTTLDHVCGELPVKEVRPSTASGSSDCPTQKTGLDQGIVGTARSNAVAKAFLPPKDSEDKTGSSNHPAPNEQIHDVGGNGDGLGKDGSPSPNPLRRRWARSLQKSQRRLAQRLATSSPLSMRDKETAIRSKAMVKSNEVDFSSSNSKTSGVGDSPPPRHRRRTRPRNTSQRSLIQRLTRHKDYRKNGVLAAEKKSQFRAIDMCNGIV